MLFGWSKSTISALLVDAGSPPSAWCLLRLSWAGPQSWGRIFRAESTSAPRKPEVGYCVMVSDTCQYAADNREFDEGEPERVVVVDDGYLDRHAPIARQRIAMAGVRLAGLLNRALADRAVP